MSTWQMLSGEGFRRIIDSESDSNTTLDCDSKALHLPSMADLLYKGCSKQQETNVSLKDSSIAFAKSILADNNTPRFASSDNTLFQTASNKKINVSAAGMARAKALLGIQEEEEDVNGFNYVNKSPSSHQQQVGFKTHVATTEQYDAHVTSKRSEIFTPPLAVTSTKFQTASGKSLSVSADALKRARSLLGDPELGTFFDDNQFVTPPNDKRLGDTSHGGNTSNKNTADSFVSPLMSSSKQFRSVKLRDLPSLGGNLIKKFDAAVDETERSKENSFITRATQSERPTSQPLVGITNRSGTVYANNKQEITQKKRMGSTISVSSFKRPRTSSFITPLKKHPQLLPSNVSPSVVSSDTLCSTKVISTRYPQRSPRLYIKDYFGMHPRATPMMNYVPDHVRRIKSSNAHRYVFGDVSTSNVVGAQALLQILVKSGASFQHTSIKWVTNHYRWIVWKLACYEKYYPTKCRGKILTITNILEELKYRYEREVNYGHCSAIKRILSGKARASSMMVLCISAINPKTNYDSHDSVKVELTDGWYSMNAALDVMLTKQLNAGKLFVGQKLRIIGAGLSGWATPTSPLETVISNRVCLLLNINGTYRAHWADRLGFCKDVGVPLAFNCIKCNGGPVPKTIAGITRIYPILYKERLGERKSLVRTERMESGLIHLRDERRNALIESLMSEYERGNNGVHSQNDSDSEEGAKIFKLLETSIEPEFLMADMTYEQLIAFSKYKERLEAARGKSVAESLEEAGLGERDVIPFIRIKLVGLMSLGYKGDHLPKEGIVTIWDPTETQIAELAEGKIYIMEGLTPINSDSETLYLHAKGSTSRWLPLSPNASDTFQEFFNPRKGIYLPDLDELPVSSEFDIAAYVVHVGDAYMVAEQRKQWVFVTDGSTKYSNTREPTHGLLAISFTIPYIGDISLPHISRDLVGSVVGFCNLIKRGKDVRDGMWVCETTENTAYFVNAQASYSSHLKTSSYYIQTWANLSDSKHIIHELGQRVAHIISAYK